MRYKEYGQLDDPPIVDGDEAFGAINTRLSPDQLQPGSLSYGQNIRLTDGVISPRPGATKFNDNFEVKYAINQSDCFDAIEYVDSESTRDRIITAGTDKAYIFDEISFNPTEVSYPVGHTISTGFLLKTSVTTLLFGDPSPSLNFTTDQTSLGKQVMRLRRVNEYDSNNNFTETATKFAFHKQIPWYRLGRDNDGSVYIRTRGTSEFIENELIYLNGSGYEAIYKVKSVDNDLVHLEIPDNDPNRPTISDTGFYADPPNHNNYLYVYSIQDQCPSASFATWAGNRLIVPVGQDDILISSPLSTHDFPEYNRLTIGSTESGNVTALEPMVDDSLVVFKQNSIYLVTGVYSMRTADQGGNLAILRISDQLGCMSNDAVQIIGQEVMFYNRQGLYALVLNPKGEGAVGLPPQAVRLTDIAVTNDIEKSLSDSTLQHDFACVHFHKGRLYLLLQERSRKRRANVTSSDTTKIFVYSMLLGKWESVDIYNGSITKLFTINNLTPLLVGVDSLNGFLLLENGVGYDSLESGNVYYDSIFSSRSYRCRTHSLKHWKRLLYNMEVTYSNSSEANKLSQIELKYDFPQKSELFNAISELGEKRSFVKLKTRADQVSFTLKTKGIGYNFHRLLFEASEGSRQTIDR